MSSLREGGSDLTRYVVEDRGYGTPCHVWIGPHNQKGYALVKVGRSSRAAHRVVYENAHGPVAAGHTVDHLCRVRDCIREDHLQAVVHRVNVRRGANQKLTRRQARAICAAARVEGADYQRTGPTLRVVAPDDQGSRLRSPLADIVTGWREQWSIVHDAVWDSAAFIWGQLGRALAAVQRLKVRL
jgi:hypothetical protein